jgi:hypothetical protein
MEHSFSTQNYDAKPTQKCVGAENPPDVFSRNLRGAVLENPDEYFFFSVKKTLGHSNKDFPFSTKNIRSLFSIRLIIIS